MSKHIEGVQEYFRAQNEGDADRVVKLFAEDGVVVNAASPAIQGHEAIRAFARGLHARTASREFTLVRLFENEDAVAAQWEVQMEFRAGAVIGPHTLATPFSVRLKGMSLFEFPADSSAIQRLDICHETTTVAMAAAANAKKQ